MSFNNPRRSLPGSLQRLTPEFRLLTTAPARYSHAVSPSRKRAARRGSVLIEASLAVSFFLVPLFLGIVQFGVFYNTTNTISQISREAGRLVAVWGDTKDDPATPADEGSDDYIKSRLIDVIKQTGLNPDDVVTSISPDHASRSQYSQATVTVQYDLSKKSLFPLFKPGTVTRQSVVMIQK